MWIMTSKLINQLSKKMGKSANYQKYPICSNNQQSTVMGLGQEAITVYKEVFSKTR